MHEGFGLSMVHTDYLARVAEDARMKCLKGTRVSESRSFFRMVASFLNVRAARRGANI